MPGAVKLRSDWNAEQMEGLCHANGGQVGGWAIALAQEMDLRRASSLPDVNHPARSLALSALHGERSRHRRAADVPSAGR